MMTLKSLWRIGAIAMCFGVQSVAFSHPGHGTTDPASPMHAAEPIHLAQVMYVICAAVAGIAIGRFVRRFQQQRSRRHK